MTTETRLAQVEGELADVTERLRLLEDRTGMEFFDAELAPTDAAEPAAAESFPEVPPAEPRQAEWGDADATEPPAAVPTPAPSISIGGSPRDYIPAPTRSALDLEALFGGRVLAWIGGLAILFGAVLFLGMAMSRGWLNEETRTIIAAAVSLIAFLGGVRLHERGGRTDAAKALVASAISGLFGTVVVATQVYSLISPELGLACGAAVAAAGFAIAVRWRSPLVAAIGSLGALTTPMMTGIEVSGSGLGIAFVAIALAATAAILVWQRWDWLALGAFVVSAPQLLVWIANEGPEHLAVGIAVLAGFWLLYAGAALGYELRARAKEMLPVASWLLLLGSCVTFVAPGYIVLDQAGHHAAAVVLLFGFAALQAGLGILALRARVHRELGSLLIGIGIGLGALGLGETFHGPGLVVAWAAAAAALAALGSRLDATSDPSLSSAERMTIAAAILLGLAIGHTLIHEAPLSTLTQGVPDIGVAVAAIGACVAAALAVGWFARRIHHELGTLVIGIAIVLVAFGLGVSLHGPTLVVAWAAGAATLAALGSRLGTAPDPLRSDAGRLLIAAGGYLALAVVRTLIVEAPPEALVHGVPDLGVAALALGACVAAAFVGGWFARRVSPDGARVVLFSGIALAAYGLGETFNGLALVVAWAAGTAILAALGSRLRDLADVERLLIAAGGYLALAVGHTLIVEAPPSALVHGVSDLGVAAGAVAACATAALVGGSFARSARPRLARMAAFAGAGILVYLGSVLIVDTIGVTSAGEVRQAGQTWLSAFWTVTGLGAVIVGLVRRTADVRLAGLALLGAAIAKVWTFDLAELDQLSRVLSFIGLGLLLLVGAFAYQRIKPEGERTEEAVR